MSEALTLNSFPINSTMRKTKESKKIVINSLKNKLEDAKLNLIYTELDSSNIQVEKKYKSVKELTKDLKRKLNNEDFQKVTDIIQNIENSLNKMINDLEIGSTNAFTKIMTSDLAKTITKTLGISLAGRTALILAPTLGTKALIGTALAGYGLYRIIKNRKEIVKINEINELNNILNELEITKDKDTIIETRFNTETQAKIREYLKAINVNFEDTGYLSLRQTLYSLDVEKKKELCDFLNILLKKEIDIDKRIKKAKRKLNVISSSATAVATGATLGIQIANTINGIDPALSAGVTNGLFISKWLESVSDKQWFLDLTKGVGLVGTELLQHIPFVGGAFQKLFSIENLITFTTVGAAGGLAASVVLSIVSTISQIIKNSKNKKELKHFLEIDTTKYAESDKIEIEKIKQKSHEPENMTEAIVVDIIYGFLKEENIVLENTATSLEDLQIELNKLKEQDRKKAKKLLDNIKYNLDKNPDFIKDLKKAGNIAIGLFTSGIAVLSIYDIIKKGAFLPELSQTLFPENNVHNLIDVPADYNHPLNPNNSKDKKIIDKSQTILDDFKTNPNYLIEDDGNAKISHGANLIVNNDGLGDTAVGMEYMKMGAAENSEFGKWFSSLLGLDKEVKKIPNHQEICNKLLSLQDKDLYEFYRYFNTLTNDNSDIYNTLKEILDYDELKNRVNNYINTFQKEQNLHNFINSVTQTVANGSIPLSTVGEGINNAKKYNNTDDFSKN